MRLAGLLLSLTIVGSGCSSKGDASNTPDPAALKAQQDLMARRDALMAERKKLETKRDALDAEIKDVTSKGGDTADLVKQRADIDKQIQKGTTEETSLSSELSKVVAQTGDMSTREAAMAERERQVAAREAAVAIRENDRRTGGGGGAVDDALIARLEAACKQAAPAAMIITSPGGGGKYTRTEADGALSRARKVMRDKGLIPGDLWAGASLESATTAAMGKNEWSAAVSTASELLRVANEFKVTPEFVRQKMKRLDGAVKSNPNRDESVKKQIEGGLGDVVNQFSSGNHNAANAKLNQLFGLVR
jgi:hypothetical protein